MKLSIAYFGDSHGYIEGDPITKLGGLARGATICEELSQKNHDLIMLHGGDILGSSPYSSYFKGFADIEAFKAFNFLSYAVGNHDFNLGTAHLAELIKASKTPFLAANLDVSEDPYLKDLVSPFIIYSTDQHNVAIIGLTTEEILKLGEQKTGRIKLLNLEASLDVTISNAKMQGAQQFIILSHMGYEIDKTIAKKYIGKNISLVILGNHTHTTTGDKLSPLSFGESKGPYPTVIDLGNKHRALITTVPHNTQVIAWLEVEYDDQNCIVRHSKNTTIVVDKSCKENQKVKQIITNYKNQLPPELTKIYAKAAIAYSGLDGQPPFAKPIEDFIRQTESPIGNLAADAFYWQAKQLDPKVDFALIHAGGIRTDWNEGSITGWDIHQLHPFDKHTIITLDLSGDEIKQALEESVYNENFHRRGEFLVSSKSLNYTYSIDEPRDKRILSLTLNHQNLLDDKAKTYRVAINGFMANANTLTGQACFFKKKLDQYKSAKSDDQYQTFAVTDREALIRYFENNPEACTLTGKLDSRIIFKGSSLLDQFASKEVSLENKYISCLNALKYNLTRLPVNICQRIIYFLSEDRIAMSTIARLNRQFNTLSKSEQWNYSLFNKHYQRSKGTLPPLLKKSSITSFHVRKGNQLVSDAMKALSEKKFDEAAKLVKQAMCIHGSSRAIILYEMMGRLGYHFKKNPQLNLKKQISSYETAERQAIRTEINNTFEQSDIKHCWEDIDKVLNLQNWLFKNSITNFETFFSSSSSPQMAKFSNTHPTPNSSLHEKFQDHIVQLPKYEKFHAEGYLGFAKSLEGSWYLSEDKKQNEQFDKITTYLT